MFQGYSQSQHLQQNSCAECSHTSNHPLPFLAAHQIVRTPVSAHLSRPVRSSVREECDDDEYYSYPSPKLGPHDLASSTPAESLPSPDPSEFSILSSSPSHPGTWLTKLSNNGQVKLDLGGVSPSPSAKSNLHHHQFYTTNMQNSRQQERQSQRSQQRQYHQQQQQLRQAMNLGGKTSADYDDTPSQGSPSRGTVYTYTSNEMFGDSSSSPRSLKKHTMWILVSSHTTNTKPFFSSPPVFIFIYIKNFSNCLSSLFALTNTIRSTYPSSPPSSPSQSPSTPS